MRERERELVRCFLHGHVSGFGGAETHICQKMEDKLDDDEGCDGFRDRVLVKTENVKLLLARERADQVLVSSL